MKYGGVVPTQQERVMREADFLVSKTDAKGRIVYGNRTFIEFSGFAEDELLGNQHNIVRHPPMGQLSRATQQNASASEELAATSEELSGQAEQLQESVRFFKLGEESPKLRKANLDIRHPDRRRGAPLLDAPSKGGAGNFRPY